MWKKVRAGLMFGVACITSPCCTPLIVPLILAGTPAAVWLGQNVGWVYGGLTLISVASLVLGLRWMNRRSSTSGSTSKLPTPVEITHSNEPNL